MKKHIKQTGFTIIELLISVSIASILIMVMMTITVYYYGDILKTQATAELALESQAVLRKIVEETRFADGIRSTNTITDANAPVGGWATNDPSDILIIASPAYDASRNIIYNNSDSFPYENESVYFKSGGTFYKRVLKNTLATGNTAKTTCPTATVTCPKDTAITSNLSNLTFVFYDVNNNTTADATAARSIAITVNLQKQSYGTLIQFNNTIRTTLRNY
jgi:prepilin-type N-terminal cleavage/methylation domain-containing protein